jgi:hypothetical protein
MYDVNEFLFLFFRENPRTAIQSINSHPTILFFYDPEFPVNKAVKASRYHQGLKNYLSSSRKCHYLRSHFPFVCRFSYCSYFFLTLFIYMMALSLKNFCILWKFLKIPMMLFYWNFLSLKIVSSDHIVCT